MKSKKKAPVNPADLIIDERYVRAGDTEVAAVTARVCSRPEMRAAAVIQKYEGANFDINFLMAELAEQIAEVHKGNMGRAEATLVAQMHTLDALFSNLARRAASQEYVGNYETFLKLALKAQSQCRATIETLATIKNPPVIYAKQANITNGNQQINNGTVVSRTQENEIAQSKLLEIQHGNYLDTPATGTTISSDQEMETVGEINRAKIRLR